MVVPGRVRSFIVTPMPVRLYALLTWTTLGRLPLINEGAARFLRRMLPAIAHRHGTRVLELGIVRDHVHLVVELPPRPDVPRLVQGLKGASARIANRDGLMPRAKLRWANGYDLRSVGVRDLRPTIRYVRSQNSRHPELALGDSPAESPGSAFCEPRKGALPAERGLSGRL